MNPARARAPFWLECGLVGLLVGLYLLIGTRQLSRPGPWWDEGDKGAYGMELALDLPPSHTDWSLRLAGRTWPLRVQHPYEFSVLPMYWSALAFKAGGVGVPILRLSELSLGAAALAVFYALCRLWLGSEAAFAACLLLAVNPAFVLMSRVGYFAVEIPLALPTLAALALLSAWHRERRVWALCAGAFCWGLSTNVATKSVAFLLAFPILYVVLIPRKDWPSPRRLAAAGSCAALGAVDFIAYNAARGMPTFRRLFGSLAAPTLSGVDNGAVPQHLALRARELLDLLEGQLLDAGAGGGAARDVILPIFVAAALAVMVRRCSSRVGFRGRRFIVFVLGLIAVLFLETAFTPNNLSPQHLLILWPYILLPVAASLDWLRTEVERRRPGWGTLAAAALLALPVASSLRTDASFFSRLEVTGGERFLSDSIYDLAGYLDRSGIRSPICLSWGMSRNTYLITQGRVKPIEGHLFLAGVEPRLLDYYAAAVADPAARFVALAGDPGVFSREYFEAFRGVVERSGRRLMLEKEFPDRQGRTMFAVWRVEKRPP
ncbi:MAG: glycosyltransferase family 39 protein [Elusimicrobiota bacterium]